MFGKFIKRGKIVETKELTQQDVISAIGHHVNNCFPEINCDSIVVQLHMEHVRFNKVKVSATAKWKVKE